MEETEEFLPIYEGPRPIPIHNYHIEELNLSPPRSGKEKRRIKRMKLIKKLRKKNKKL